MLSTVTCPILLTLVSLDIVTLFKKDLDPRTPPMSHSTPSPVLPYPRLSLLISECFGDTSVETNPKKKKAAKFMAVLFPQSAMSSRDGCSTEDAESSIASVNSAPPLKGKHFIWTCQIDNATDCVSVKACALINSGAHMVLIRSDLVKRLNLSSYPLGTPECVSVALGSNDHIDHLTHYVVIDPASLDNHFCSQPLHAVIAPGLCMLLILGLPFLCINCVLCNYANHTCLISTMLPPYNLMATVPKQSHSPVLNMPLSDILASLKDQEARQKKQLKPLANQSTLDQFIAQDTPQTIANGRDQEDTRNSDTNNSTPSFPEYDCTIIEESLQAIGWN